jgi:hypothetical protein
VVPDTKGKYTDKGPQIDGKVMEVGLAQCLTSYVGGNKEIKETVDMVLKKLHSRHSPIFNPRTYQPVASSAWSTRRGRRNG